MGLVGHSSFAARQGKLVRLEDSAAKCVRILLENKFKSGSHIDYYDEV